MQREHDVHIGLATTRATRVALVGDPDLGQPHLLFPTESAKLRGTSESKPAIALGRGAFRDSFMRLVDDVQPDVVWYHEKYVVRVTGFHGSIRSIVDIVDVQWLKLMRWARYLAGTQKGVTYFKAFASWIEDNWICQRADATVIANAEERRLLTSRKPIICVPNAFDFPEDLCVTRREGKRIVFFGSLFYYPNLDGIAWFCSEVWPLILRRVPDAQLDVAGASDGELPISLLKQVVVHGFVEDLDPLVASSALLVVPLRIGGGTRVKILEAWSRGLPVVSTTVGAEGLAAEDGSTLLIADTGRDFADACVRVLEDPDLGVRLATDGFNYGRRHYDWSCIRPGLRDALSAATRALPPSRLNVAG